MIVAGVGFRRSAVSDEIVALVTQALARADLAPTVLARLATIKALAALPAFTEAAERLAVPVQAVDDAELAAAAPAIRTLSERSLAAHGVGSVAEAAALGAAGPGATLLLTRIQSSSVTCALAQSTTPSEIIP